MYEKIKEILNGIDVYEDYVHGKSPDNYVVFQEVQSTGIYADSKAIERQVNCVIDVLETLQNKKQLAKQVEELLNLNDINYIKLNLGYLPEIKKTQVTFDFYL